MLQCVVDRVYKTASRHKSLLIYFACSARERLAFWRKCVWILRLVLLKMVHCVSIVAFGTVSVPCIMLVCLSGVGCLHTKFSTKFIFSVLDIFLNKYKLGF